MSTISKFINPSQDDLVGLLAFAYFELSKEEKASECKKKKESFDPSVFDANLTPCGIDANKTKAQKILQNVIEIAIKEKMNELVLSVSEQISSTTKKQNSFWRGVWQNCIASLVISFIYTLVIIGILIFNNNSITFDISDAIKLNNESIKHQGNSPTASTN